MVLGGGGGDPAIIAMGGEKKRLVGAASFGFVGLFTLFATRTSYRVGLDRIGCPIRGSKRRTNDGIGTYLLGISMIYALCAVTIQS